MGQAYAKSMVMPTEPPKPPAPEASEEQAAKRPLPDAARRALAEAAARREARWREFEAAALAARTLG